MEKEEYNKMLEEIDHIELIPEEEYKNMDFYELAYYLQTLNQITSLENNLSKGEEE